MTPSPPEKVVHLNRYYHFTELMRDPGIEGRLQRYQAQHDATTQSVLVLKPTQKESDKIFFFFHGMDGDCGDAVVVRDLVTRVGATVVAMGGRGPAWLSTPFLADAQQVIRRYSQGFLGFYLIGISMGATQVLSLAGLMADDLRASVLGVVALMPGTNLPAIYERSANDRVKNTVLNSVGGDLSLLQARSPAHVMYHYKGGLPFVIFCREQDSLLLADEMTPFMTRLRENNHPVAAYLVAGEHDFTYENFDYQTAVEKLGTHSTEHNPPLRVRLNKT